MTLNKSELLALLAALDIAKLRLVEILEGEQRIKNIILEKDPDNKDGIRVCDEAIEIRLFDINTINRVVADIEKGEPITFDSQLRGKRS